MTAGPQVKGWCPGALRPMLSGDGWMVRVRPHGGRLTQVQAQGIARLAALHGNGRIDISARANLQIRGVTETSHTPLIVGLRDLGLIDPTPEAEARRNILVSPFWTPGDGTQDIAAALDKALAAPDAPDLPGKFGFSIDPARWPVLRKSSADVRIERLPTGWLVRAEGFIVGALVASHAEAAEAAVELARWFVDIRDGAGSPGRMAGLWPKETVQQRHRRLPGRFRHESGGIVWLETKRPSVGACPQGRLVGLAFGQTDAPALAALADCGALRLTPWRMLLVEGLAAPPGIPGLIHDPDDPLLNVIACTGAPGCPQALGETRALARDLAPQVLPGMTLHVSGCAKGCAHPGPTDLTLTATGHGYDLIRNGSASDTPSLTGLAPETIRDFLKASHAPHL